MNNIIKQLKKSAKNTHLSSAEKAEMKSVLLQYVESHSVDQTVLFAHSIPSPFYTCRFRNKKTISALLIGSLLVGSSVSFAAEGAVPGDILYPVKLSVNEGVRRVVAVTPEAKAELEVKLVERRLVEVEKLAGDPNATLKAQEEAAELLKKYTHAANERFETVENDNDGDEDTHIITNLSAVLVNHERILTEIHSEMVRVEEEESRRSSDGESHERNTTSSTRVITAPSTTTVSTATVATSSEHTRNIESVNSALKYVRDSIKEIEERDEEDNKKENSTRATSTTAVTEQSIKKEGKQKNERKSSRTTSARNTATSTTPVVIPAKIGADEHQAVIETHHENTVATSTRATEERKSSETQKERAKTEDEDSRKAEDSHTETSRNATSTSERD